MHEPPKWVATASDRAMITRDELLQWLGCEARDLSKLIANRGLPRPRRAGVHHTGQQITKTCQWLVGDIRAWLRGAAPGAQGPTESSRGAGLSVSKASRRIAFGSGIPKKKYGTDITMAN